MRDAIYATEGGRVRVGKAEPVLGGGCRDVAGGDGPGVQAEARTALPSRGDAVECRCSLRHVQVPGQRSALVSSGVSAGIIDDEEFARVEGVVPETQCVSAVATEAFVELSAEPVESGRGERIDGLEQLARQVDGEGFGMGFGEFGLFVTRFDGGVAGRVQHRRAFASLHRFHRCHRPLPWSPLAVAVAVVDSLRRSVSRRPVSVWTDSSLTRSSARGMRGIPFT